MGCFFCPISGCTPEIVRSLADMRCRRQFSLALNVVRALIDLQDRHEYLSQNDLSVIGPIHPSDQPLAAGLVDGMFTDREAYECGFEAPGTLPSDVSPETDVRVISNGFLHDDEFVHAGSTLSEEGFQERWKYFIAYGSSLAVQTYALDIMALATTGRMTPLRLWRLAMKQGFYENSHPVGLEGVNYGEVGGGGWKDYPDFFPGFGKKWNSKINKRQSVEVLKQQFVHEGKFWIWMAPDRFPVSPTEHDSPAPTLLETRLSETDLSVIEKLPSEVLVSIVSILLLGSLVNIASTSRFLRTSIFGNEYYAHAWLRTSAPWWIPVQVRTGTEKPPMTRPYPASQLMPDDQTVEGHLSIVGLDWAYIRRCARSGSMRNRRRIWNAVLDIERVADLACV